MSHGRISSTVCGSQNCEDALTILYSDSRKRIEQGQHANASICIEGVSIYRFQWLGRKRIRKAGD